MKIGVLSDTHVPDLLPALPARVLELFRGVDIILHAGDICDLRVLQQLEAIAQTYAVVGNRDSLQVKKYVQEAHRLEFANRAIGLIHGHHAWEGSLWARGRYALDHQARDQAMFAYVLHEFKDVHAVVFGHTHHPYMKMHGSVFLFNPGAVAPLARQPATVGMLEIGENTIKGRILAL